MYWDVNVIKPKFSYRIYVEIADGEKGLFDLKAYLNKGVFKELKNINYFNQVGILFGAITWHSIITLQKGILKKDASKIS